MLCTERHCDHCRRPRTLDKKNTRVSPSVAASAVDAFDHNLIIREFATSNQFIDRMHFIGITPNVTTHRNEHNRLLHNKPLNFPCQQYSINQ